MRAPIPRPGRARQRAALRLVIPAQLLSERIKLRRLALGMDRAVFAVQVGVSRSTVEKWEDGQKRPWVGHRARLAEVLQLTDIGGASWEWSHREPRARTTENDTNECGISDAEVMAMLRRFRGEVA